MRYHKSNITSEHTLERFTKDPFSGDVGSNLIPRLKPFFSSLDRTVSALYSPSVDSLKVGDRYFWEGVVSDSIFVEIEEQRLGFGNIFVAKLAYKVPNKQIDSIRDILQDYTSASSKIKLQMQTTGQI